MMVRDPTAYNPPWFAQPNPTATIYSPTPRSPISVMTPVNANGDFSPISSPTNTTHESLLTALSRYLPSNQPNKLQNGTVFDSDEFRMYDFKVRGCTRPNAHDWTDCPFTHPGEKARRRDPRRHSYSGTACSDHRKGICRRGDSCEFAHGVFESWLHPTRYRTQPCKDGRGCTRRVCFFAHAPGQLRVGPGLDPLSEVVASIRSMQLTRPVWDSVEFDVAGSPRSAVRPGFYSLDLEEENMERVESGREVRARMFEKLSKENPLGGLGRVLN